MIDTNIGHSRNLLNLKITGDFDLPAGFIDTLSDKYVVDHNRTVTDYDELAEWLSDAHVYVIGGSEYASREVLDNCPNIKLIVVLGTGTNSFIDLDYAISKNIEVHNTPYLNQVAVANFAVGAIIFNSTSSLTSVEQVRSGTSWLQPVRCGLDSSVIGILGLGHVGSLIADKLRYLFPETTILHYSTSPKEIERELNIQMVEKDELLRKADILCLTVSFTESTRHFVGHKELGMCKPWMRLFNFSNPNVVEPKALRDWLTGQNSMPFAYFDGYYQEWVDNEGTRNDPYGLLALPYEKFVATSHIAALERPVLQAMLLEVQRKLLLPSTFCG